MDDVIPTVVPAAGLDIRGSTSTAQLLMAAAPRLLWTRPTALPVVEPCMAIIWELRVHSASCMNSLPGPIAVHLHVLPNHAEARIHTRWAGAFATFALLGAAPMLLLW